MTVRPSRSGWRHTPPLAGIVLLSSAAALVVEIAAARLLAPIVGMSLFTWTAIIAVVLAGFSAGHWIGGRLAGGRAGRSVWERRLALSLVSAGLTVVISVLAHPAAPAIISALGGVRVASVLLLTGALFLIPSLAAGVVTPLATAIAVDRDPPEGRAAVLARMFAASAGGAILGVLGAGYVLVPVLGAVGALVLVALVQCGLALVVWRDRAMVLFSVAIVAFCVLLVTRPGDCDVESAYYCLKLEDTTEITGYPSRGLEIDRWLHSVEARDGSDRLYIESHDFVDALARRDKDGLRGMAAAFIGGGGLTLPELWRRSGAPADLTVLEIDPEVTRFAAENLSVDVSAPLNVVHRDGRAGLRALPAEARFDVIYNDAYTGLTMPAHLVTREFQAEVAARLGRDGFYVINLIDVPRRPRFLASLVRTLRADFTTVEIWRRDGLGDGFRRMHYGLVARDTPTPFAILASASGTGRSWTRLDGAAEAAVFDGVTGMVLTDDLAPVDRLLANFCSLAFLRYLSIDLSRIDACR